MNHTSVLSDILSDDQKVLHLLLDQSVLENTDKFTEYHTAGPEDSNNLILDFNQEDFALKIPKGYYDTILLTTVLEHVDNPVDLITKLKYLSEYVVILEFKYDTESQIDPSWKQPWKTMGLTWNLQQHFDLINELFLQDATLLTCKLPYTPKEPKENINAIR